MQQQAGTGLLRFKLRRGAGIPATAPFFGSPVEVVSFLRETSPGCPALLGLTAAARGAAAQPAPDQQCGRWAAQLGGQAGPGPEQWVLEDAGGGWVRIRFQVSRRCCVLCQQGRVHGTPGNREWS